MLYVGLWWVDRSSVCILLGTLSSRFEKKRKKRAVPIRSSESKYFSVIIPIIVQCVLGVVDSCSLLPPDINVFSKNGMGKVVSSGTYTFVRCTP